jgi:hypothetical protein
MTDGATFAQRRVLEDKGPGLLAMALRTRFIGAGHCQATSGFENVAAMRVMALGAAHVLLDQRMMLWQMKLGLRLPVTLEARRGGFSGINNQSPPAARGYVQTARSVTGFTAGLANGTRVIQPDPRMRARGKDSGNIRVTLRAGLIAHKCRSRHIRSRAKCHWSG